MRTAPEVGVWLVSLFAGVVAGVAFMVIPIAIYPAAVLFIWAELRPPRLAKASGTLVGAGAAVLLILINAQQRCISNTSCAPPSDNPVLPASVILIAVGAGLGFAAWMRRDEIRATTVVSGQAVERESPKGRAGWWFGRALLYFAVGVGVGFLFLAEFALSTVALVQVVIALLALTGLIGGVRGRPNLSVWSMFVVGALLMPLLVDSRSFLPLCQDVGPAVGCIARDYRGQFAAEIASFLVSCMGLLLYLRLGLKR